MAKAAAATEKKATITEMLAALNDAFEVAEEKKAALAQAQDESLKAIARAQAQFSAVQADYQARTAAAAKEADDARQALEALRGSVNERIGTLTGQPTDPRVSVK